MRLRNVKDAGERIQSHPEWVIPKPESNRGFWNEVFHNDHPIYLEIGCGKGKYLLEMARLHPEINFIGMEKFDSVIIRTLQKVLTDPHDNIRLLRSDAVFLPDIFQKGEVKRVLLNFSDPWPKPSHAKRRLTSPEYLARYHQILLPGSKVIFKTDNFPLFAFSMRSIVEDGMKVNQITLDLHQTPEIFNVETEFESKFVAMGKPIFYIESTCEE